ncbi:distal membrane-arm assembly complex protein 2-like [Watersipora subatra]|uniref:distal membrane-arm assembly complex protein 2-like n=1 Tax=Watersipora subatra TaxID=2589382 RepID=UPI00355B74FF
MANSTAKVFTNSWKMTNFQILMLSSQKWIQSSLGMQIRTLKATVSPAFANNQKEGMMIDKQAGEVVSQHEHKRWVEFNPSGSTVAADWMSFLSQKIDWSTFIDDKLAERQLEKLRTMQAYSSERRRELGGELAAARFVVAMNGEVKLHDDSHIYSRSTEKDKGLPMEKTSGLFVEAIDLSKTQLIYEGIENLFQMEKLVHLSLSSCSRLDEWSISRLAMIPSLVSLDLSDNPFITERSLIPLQHLPKLQKIDLRGIKYFTDLPLPLIYLEQMLPNCVISTDSDSSV